MLAPVSLPTAQPTLLDSFAELLHAARLEALAVLRSLMLAGADGATPAAVLRERRLAAAAILRVPCEPAQNAPARPASIGPAADASALLEQRVEPGLKPEPPTAPDQPAVAPHIERAPPIPSAPPAPAFKQRRGATPIASLSRRARAPDAHAGGSG